MYCCEHRCDLRATAYQGQAIYAAGPMGPVWPITGRATQKNNHLVASEGTSASDAWNISPYDICS